MAIQAEVGLLKEAQLHRLMREVLRKILVRPIERLATEVVLRFRRLFRPVHLLDKWHCAQATPSSDGSPALA